MTEQPEPPTIILPGRRCWRWYARRPHRPHLIGNPPTVYRCEGFKPPEPETSQRIDP